MTPTTMGCREAIERLWVYLDDELDEVDHRAIEEHLTFCLRCCGELAFAREVRTALSSSAVPPPADVQDRLEAFIEQLDPPQDPTVATPDRQGPHDE